LDDIKIFLSADIESPFEEILPQGLTTEERQLLIWHFREQLAYDEIAERLHISVLACRTRVFRAKEHCKALLAT
jgi:RNA polymerase sigma-70 factor (ECF subfamily)